MFLFRNKKTEQYNLQYCTCVVDKVYPTQTLSGAWPTEHEGSSCKKTGSSIENQTQTHDKLKSLIFSHIVRIIHNVTYCMLEHMLEMTLFTLRHVCHLVKRLLNNI